MANVCFCIDLEKKNICTAVGIVDEDLQLGEDNGFQLIFFIQY